MTSGRRPWRPASPISAQEHPDTYRNRDDLAAAYIATGRADRAIPLLDRMLKIRMARLGPEHDDTLDAQLELASAYEKIEASDKAEPLLRGLLAARRRALGDDHPDVAQACDALGQNLIGQRRWAEAEPPLRAGLAIRAAKIPDDWRRFGTESLLGGSLLGQGNSPRPSPSSCPASRG